MEPHAVDDLSHVPGPISFIHGLDLLLLEDLLVHAPLLVRSVVVQLAGSVVQRFIEGGGENFVHVLDIGDKVSLTWSLSSYSLLGFKVLEQCRLFSGSFHLYDLVKVDYLLVVDGAAHRSRFNEVAEIGGLCQFVDKSLWPTRILVSSKLLIVEEIS